MSGIAGIVHLDGAPVDRALISEMAAALAFRGPDAQNVWATSSVAFAHTLLKTTYEAEHEQQPASLDGQVWITADARIDAREDLARELGLPRSALSQPDCELILHAYARWGETCVNHLLGDFAFAIWDERTKKLFCARDHFGVKPFYYAHLADIFIFSNTLNCIRMHPHVSDELNELAIADFLVFDFNQDPATTTFTDIQRLPPAHTLIATANAVITRGYWSLPEGERIRYRRTRDYVEHFCDLLETAIADRLRTKAVTIWMSGGLDSSSVAAFARQSRPETELRAQTVVYDWLIPDNERYFSGLVAKFLRIQINYTSIDSVRPYDHIENFCTPEPVHDPLRSSRVAPYLQNSSLTAVMLTGLGADSLMCLSPLVNWNAVGAIPRIHTALNFGRYVWEFRTFPRFRLRSSLRHFLGCLEELQIKQPPWLRPEFASRCHVADRIATYLEAYSFNNEIRPFARRDLCSIYWPNSFESDDAAWFNSASEYRHPFFDTRIVRYFLGIPELPFSMDKYLLRLAIRDMVPDAIRKRPKAPLRSDPLYAAFKQFKLCMAQQRTPQARLHEFVNPDAVSVITSVNSAEQLWVDSRVTSLDYWFHFEEETRKCRMKRAPLSVLHTIRPN